MALPYQSGSTNVRTKYNFVAAFDIHKPDVDPVLTLAFGRQMLTGLMTMVGNKKETNSLQYEHHEEQRIMPKILATTAGAGAGAQATFTLAASALETVNFNNAPYNATTTEQNIPPRVGDLLLIKPSSGTISASTYIRAYVDSINEGAGTFTALPTDSTDSIPAISSADEIVIFSNAFGEESTAPLSRNSKTVKSTNNVHIFRDTHVITGSEEKVILWTNVKDPEGRSAPYWSIKGEKDTYTRFLNHRELGLLLSEQISNVTLENAEASNDKPIKTTEGLIPFILANGNVSNYSSVTGWTLADAKAFVKELDKNKGSKENLLYCGIDLSGQIDDELGDRFKDGAINYGNFSFDEEKAVSLEFHSFSVNGYKFHKKVYDAMNDLQTLGADGFTFPFEGLVIPMDSRIGSDPNSPEYREEIPSLRLRYLEGREIKTSYIDRFDVDGLDRMEVHYLSECGFEGFAGNRFGYIKRN